MALGADTGHGATITFGTTGGTWLCREIGELNLVTPRVDSTHLNSTVNRDYIPGDLADQSPVTLMINFQGTQGLPAHGVVETITITHPTKPGGSTPATVAGTAFIHETKFPKFATNAIQEASITFSFNGDTGPTYTAAT